MANWTFITWVRFLRAKEGVLFSSTVIGHHMRCLEIFEYALTGGHQASLNVSSEEEELVYELAHLGRQWLPAVAAAFRGLHAAMEGPMRSRAGCGGFCHGLHCLHYSRADLLRGSECRFQRWVASGRMNTFVACRSSLPASANPEVLYSLLTTQIPLSSCGQGVINVTFDYSFF